MSATYTVGDGKTYATPQAAFAAIVAALSGDISGQGVHTIEVYAKAAGYADGAIDLSTGLVGQSATDYVDVVAMEDHGGMRDAGIVLDIGTTLTNQYILLGNYTRFHGFCVTGSQWETGGAGWHSIISGRVDFARIYDNIVYDMYCYHGDTIAAINIWKGGRCYNNQVFHVGADNTAYPTGFGIHIRYGTIGDPVLVHNNTIVSPSSGSVGVIQDGITIADGYAHVHNNVVMDTNGLSAADFVRISVLGTFEYNVSSDATAGAADGCLSNKVAANQFTSLVAGSEDFRLLVGADCNRNGSDQSSLFTDDCRGYTRDPAGFNTGAFEYEDYVPAADLDTLIQPAMLGAIASGH